MDWRNTQNHATRQYDIGDKQKRNPSFLLLFPVASRKSSRFPPIHSIKNAFSLPKTKGEWNKWELAGTPFSLPPISFFLSLLPDCHKNMTPVIDTGIHDDTVRISFLKVNSVYHHHGTVVIAICNGDTGKVANRIPEINLSTHPIITACQGSKALVTMVGDQTRRIIVYPCGTVLCIHQSLCILSFI